MEPSRPSRKQPVSVDDMMDRLKTRPTGGSRVVDVKVVDGETREIRKKRKRRSHQPKKIREARISRLKRVLFFVLVPLCLALIAGWYLLTLRYKGETFRESLSKRVSDVLGLSTEVSPLEPDGFSLDSRRMLIRGKDSGMLKEIELMDLKSNMGIGSHFSKDWRVESLTAQTCTVRLRETDGLAMNQPPLQWRRSSRLMMAGLGLSNSPGRFNVDFFRVGECEVIWHPGDEDADLETLASGVLLTGGGVDARTPMSFTGGRLTLPGWPELELEHGKMELSKDDLRIDEVRMERESFGDLEGLIKGSGVIKFAGAGQSTMAFEFRDLDVRDFLPENWQHKVIGKATGKLKVRSELGRPNSMEADGEFSMPDCVLGNLHSLKRLSTFAGDANLARIVFENGLTGKIRINSRGVEFYDVKGSSSDLFRMEGNITFLANEKVEGSMRIGISHEILKEVKGGKPAFFGPVEDDVCWTSVVLSGKQAQVRDDLTDRFEVLLRDIEQREKEARMSVKPLSEHGTKIEPQSGDQRSDSQNKSLENVFDSLIGE